MTLRTISYYITQSFFFIFCNNNNKRLLYNNEQNSEPYLITNVYNNSIIKKLEGTAHLCCFLNKTKIWLC